MTDSQIDDGYAEVEAEAEPKARRRLPLPAAVLLADAGVAFVAFLALIVISVQRYGDGSKSSNDSAYVEALIVIFVVTALFAAAGVLLMKSGQKRAGVMQIAIMAAVLACGLYAAVEGPPKADPSVTTPIDQFTDDPPATSAS